jgi:arginase
MRIRTVKLLGVAAGSGAGNPGAEGGPDALRELGLNKRLEAIGLDVIHSAADYEGSEISRNLPEVLQVNRHTYAAIRTAFRNPRPDEFLLITGGDHSLAIGTLAGVTDACRRLGILWIDAHADFNTPLTSPSGNIHGMSLAIATGRGHRELKAIAESEPMAEDADVYLLGCRDIDEGEVDNLQESEVHWLTMQQWRQAGVVRTALAAAQDLAGRCDHIHMSFDIDVIDPVFVPGTGTPVKGGLSSQDALTLLTELGRSGVLRSAEVVEYNPTLDTPDRATGRLTCDLIVALMEALARGA